MPPHPLSQARSTPARADDSGHLRLAVAGPFSYVAEQTSRRVPRSSPPEATGAALLGTPGARGVEDSAGMGRSVIVPAARP